jgi:hypothetical protein
MINRWKLSRATRPDATKAETRVNLLGEPLAPESPAEAYARQRAGHRVCCGFEVHAPTCEVLVGDTQRFAAQPPAPAPGASTLTACMAFVERRVAEPAQAEAPKPAAPSASEPGMPEGWRPVNHDELGWDPDNKGFEHVSRRAAVWRGYGSLSTRWIVGERVGTGTIRYQAVSLDVTYGSAREAALAADARLAALDAQKAPSESAKPARFKVGDRVRLKPRSVFTAQAEGRLGTITALRAPDAIFRTWGYTIEPDGLDYWQSAHDEHDALEPAPETAAECVERAHREADAMLRGGR